MGGSTLADAVYPLMAELTTMNSSLYADISGVENGSSAVLDNETATNNSSFPPVRTRDEELAKIEMGILSCIFIVTLMGNFIVVLGIYFRRQKMTRMYYFILHLSLADIFTAFFNVGSQLGLELTFPDFLGGNALCKFVKFTQILGPYSSSYVLVMTAIDRYQAICYPLSNCTWTARRSKLMLGIAWAISLLFCIPQLFIFSLQKVPGYENYDCWGSFPTGGQEVYVVWYSISFFIVPLIILIFAYSGICRAIWLNLSMKTAARKLEFGLPEKANFCNSETENGQTPVNNKAHRGTDGRVLNLNRLNSTGSNGKHLEVSWRMDHKGNVNTETSGDRGPRWESCKRGSADSYSASSSPEQENSDFCDLSEGHSSAHDVEIIPNGRGVKYTTVNGRNGIPEAGLKTKLRFKWPARDNRSKSVKDTALISGNTGKMAEIKPSALTNGSRSRSLENGNTNGSTQLLLVPLNSRSSANGSSSRTNSGKNGVHLSTQRQSSNYNQPRSSSVKGISRAKIKTVKLTVTVICCYIFCSSPFIAAQLWVTFDPQAVHSPFYTGKSAFDYFMGILQLWAWRVARYILLRCC